MHWLARTRLIKTVAASLAYVPMLVLLVSPVFQREGFLAEPIVKAIRIGCILFNFPAFSILALIRTFPINPSVQAICGIALMFIWSSFLAWFFWRAAGTL